MNQTLPQAPKIICLGEILFDLLSENLGVTTRGVEKWTPYVGGAPANVAFGLSKLGVSVAFLGRVGTDTAGLELVKSLESHPIHLEGIQHDPKAPTRKVFVERNHNGDRKFAGFGDFNTDEFADTFLDEKLIPWDLIASAQYLVMGTSLMAYPKSFQAIQKILGFCMERSIQTILDINWRPIFWEDQALGIRRIHESIQEMDILKFSKEEAELLFHTSEISILAKLLPKASILLITDGDQGCHYKIEENYGFVPSFKVEVQDTTGAGDSFLAGFIFQLLETSSENLPINERRARNMVVFASAMGAITTTKLGAVEAQPTLESIRLFLERNK